MPAARTRIATPSGKIPPDAPVTGRDFSDSDNHLLLSDFASEQEFVIPGAAWQGYSDRVMGGISDATFNRDNIDGRRCLRMTGRVTREGGGGFIQVALKFDHSADASPYSGIELLIHGNDEDYNAHIRTADCGWYEESYRATFHAEKCWQTIRLPWSDFSPNGVSVPLDTSKIIRLGLLGWMRDFQADLAVGGVALYAPE